MNDIHKNYLIENLENGRELKIVFLAQNAYWGELLLFDNRYPNCDVKVYGDGAFYISKPESEIEDCDIIIYYSSGFFDEKDYSILRNIASRISTEKNKRVTIGYSSFVTDKEKKTNYYTNFSSVKEGKEIAEGICIYNHPSSETFANMVLSRHDEYLTYDKAIIDKKDNNEILKLSKNMKRVN